MSYASKSSSALQAGGVAAGLAGLTLAALASRRRRLEVLVVWLPAQSTKSSPQKPFLILQRRFGAATRRDRGAQATSIEPSIEDILLDRAITKYPVVLTAPFDGGSKEAAHENRE